MKIFIVILALLLLPSPASAHKFYFTSDTAAPQTMSSSGAWNDENGATERLLSSSKGSTSMATGSVIDITEDQFEWDEMDRRYISRPMNSGQTIGGPSNYYHIVAMVREYAATDDVVWFCHHIRIMSKDGTVQRNGGNLYCNSGTSSNEFINNTTHRTQRSAYGSSYNSYTTQQGDRIVLELGYRTDGAETTPQASARWGESATECPLDDTTTTDCAGFLEFQNVTLTFESEGPTRRRVMQTGWLDTIKMWFGPKEALAEFVQ